MKEAASCWWEANNLGRGFSWRCGCAALVLTAIIVAAAFTFIPAFVPAVHAAEIPVTIVGMSGTVEITTDGSNWRPLVSSDTISSGDSVMTGSDGLLLVQFSSGSQILGKILLGENTNITYIDPHHHHRLQILLGILWASVQSATGGSDDFEADIGDTAVAGIRGTELTAAAYGNGTANVMVIEGLVEVQDVTSNSTVSLQTNQTITVPYTSGGLSQQEMSQAVETVNPTANGAWWEQTSLGPIATITPSSTTFPITTLAIYLVAVVAVAVTVTGALVVYTRRRKAKALKHSLMPSTN